MNIYVVAKALEMTDPEAATEMREAIVDLVQSNLRILNERFSDDGGLDSVDGVRGMGIHVRGQLALPYGEAQD